MKLRLFVIILLFSMLGACQSSPTTTEEPRNTETTFMGTLTTNIGDVVIQFETNGGTPLNSLILNQGDTVPTFETPTKEGYLFQWWYIDEALTTPFTASSIDASLTLYAKWQPLQEDDVVVTFTSVYGTPSQSLVGKPGEALELPSPGVDPLHDFLGWWDEETSTDYASLDAFPDASITLEAKWVWNGLYQITFETNHDTTFDPLYIAPGAVVPWPDDLSMDGYIFLGWYLDEDLTSAYTLPNTMPEMDLTLYAKWVLLAEYTYTVTYETSGGSNILQEIKVMNTKVIEPQDPIKEGFLFDGWFEDEAFTIPFDFDSYPTSDVTLYAKWTADPTYSVITLVISETESEIKYIAQGETIPLYDAIRDGHIFDGWYWDARYTAKFHNDYLGFVEPQQFSIYAKWIEAPNVVYLNFETYGGDYVQPVQGNPGEYIVYCPKAYKDGYTFEAWYLDEAYTQFFTAGGSYGFYMPNETTTVYAKYISSSGGASNETGGVEDLKTLLMDDGFTCDGAICTYEEYSGYTYEIDTSTGTFSYITHVIDEDASGHRYYDRTITITNDWQIEYVYTVDENYGVQIYIEITVEGDVLTENYNVTHFYSNVTTEAARLDIALDSMNLFIQYVEWLLEVSSMTMDDFL